MNGVRKTLCPFFTTETKGKLDSVFERIDSIIKKTVDNLKHLNLEVDGDRVQELLASHNQELTIDELIAMRDMI